jgi:enamine deaminase RidA (YjgF/YER057c/UK114 family)
MLLSSVGRPRLRKVENVKFLLGSCGATMDDIVKVVVYMRDVNNFNNMDQVYREYFTKGQDPPELQYKLHHRSKASIFSRSRNSW